MANKLIYISYDDTQNYPLQLGDEAFEYSTYEPTIQ